MASKQKQKRREYVLFGRTVNLPQSVAKVIHPLAPPAECRYCKSTVELVNNAVFYKVEYGWPLAYCCCGCGARVGCHPGTDIPLGVLANEQTMNARRAAHAVFDRLWQGKTAWHRQEAYRTLSRVMGVRAAHIAHFDESECLRVIELCQSGAFASF